MIGIVCIKILNTIVNHKHGGLIVFNLDRWLSRSTAEKAALKGAMPWRWWSSAGTKLSEDYRVINVIMVCVAVAVAPMSPIVSVITGISAMGVGLPIGPSLSGRHLQTSGANLAPTSAHSEAHDGCRAGEWEIGRRHRGP